MVLSRYCGSDWRFPGGGKPGESPFDTCHRELFEELSVDLTPGDLMVTTFTVPLRPMQQGRGRLNYLFDCGVHRAGQLPIGPQRSEITQAEWIPQAEAMTVLHPGSRHSINLARRGRHYGELREKSRAQGTRRALLRGLPGMGKTTLAATWLARPDASRIDVCPVAMLKEGSGYPVIVHEVLEEPL